MKDRLQLLHKQCATESVSGEAGEKFFELVWTHCQIVSKIALQLGRRWQEKTGNQIDLELVELGALAHDIGVYQCYFADFHGSNKKADYVWHGVFGGDLLIQHGFSKKLAGFAYNHIRISRKDIEEQQLLLPKRNFLPETCEEELVAFADRFHTKHPRFTTYEEELIKVEKFGPEKVALIIGFKEKFGLPDFTELEKEYTPWHREFKKYLAQQLYR